MAANDGKTAITVTITTGIADPDAAIAWVREQLAAALGTQGDAGEEGWKSATIGTPRWQIASVRAIRDGGNERR